MGHAGAFPPDSRVESHAVKILYGYMVQPCPRLAIKRPTQRLLLKIPIPPHGDAHAAPSSTSRSPHARMCGPLAAKCVESYARNLQVLDTVGGAELFCIPCPLYN